MWGVQAREGKKTYFYSHFWIRGEGRLMWISKRGEEN